jgi:hypothetical protein
VLSSERELSGRSITTTLLARSDSWRERFGGPYTQLDWRAASRITGTSDQAGCRPSAPRSSARSPRTPSSVSSTAPV